ncbi:MAG: SPFH domain-containing protein [Myxococcales bacterium]|nr:SPFH domain-containing protein [Myxococcales bacterium]
MILYGIIAGVCAYLLFFVSAQCAFRVDEGALAALTRFGAARRDSQGKILLFSPGLHFKLPWDHLRLAPVREQSLHLAGQIGGTTAIASDGTVVHFDGVLRHAADPARVEQYLFGCDDPTEHLANLFMCLVRNEIANYAVGDGQGQPDEVAWSQLRRDSRQLSDQLEQRYTQRLAQRYGVVFSGVDLKDILPPDALVDALNAVMNARIQAQADYALAEADSARRVMAAQHNVEVARRKAQAAATEIKELARALAQLQRDGILSAYVDRRRVEILSQAKHLLVGSAA